MHFHNADCMKAEIIWTLNMDAFGDKPLIFVLSDFFSYLVYNPFIALIRKKLNTNLND